MLTNRKLERLDRIMIEQAKTRFTYRSILKIKNVTKEDSTMYTCSNKEEMEYFLQVHGKYFALRCTRVLSLCVIFFIQRSLFTDALPPQMRETNLNETEITVDISTQGRKEIILQCFVTGMPKPLVTWYRVSE